MVASVRSILRILGFNFFQLQPKWQNFRRFLSLKNRKNRNSKTLFDPNKISRIHVFHHFPSIVMVLIEPCSLRCTLVPNYEGLYAKMMTFRNFVWVKNHLRVNIFRIFHFQKTLLIRQNWQVKIFFL